MRSTKEKKHYVYTYMDINDDIIKYVGITDNMKRRYNQHLKNDAWCNEEDYIVQYIEVDNQAIAEAYESDLIARYKTYQYYNEAKTGWGTINDLKPIDEWHIFDPYCSKDTKYIYIKYMHKYQKLKQSLMDNKDIPYDDIEKEIVLNINNIGVYEYSDNICDIELPFYFRKFAYTDIRIIVSLDFNIDYCPISNITIRYTDTNMTKKNLNDSIPVDVVSNLIRMYVPYFTFKEMIRLLSSYDDRSKALRDYFYDKKDIFNTDAALTDDDLSDYLVKG